MVRSDEICENSFCGKRYHEFYRIKRKLFKAGIFLLGLLLFAMVYARMSESIMMPVQNTNRNSYEQHSFGALRVGHPHRGVDIFVPKRTPVLSAPSGIVAYTGVLSLGE